MFFPLGSRLANHLERGLATYCTQAKSGLCFTKGMLTPQLFDPVLVLLMTSMTSNYSPCFSSLQPLLTVT